MVFSIPLTYVLLIYMISATPISDSNVVFLNVMRNIFCRGKKLCATILGIIIRLNCKDWLIPNDFAANICPLPMTFHECEKIDMIKALATTARDIMPMILGLVGKMNHCSVLSKNNWESC